MIDTLPDRFTICRACTEEMSQVRSIKLKGTHPWAHASFDYRGARARDRQRILVLLCSQAAEPCQGATGAKPGG
jgi:hypothetical protein